MAMTSPEEVDILFVQWFNREQPLETIVREPGPGLSASQHIAIRKAIRQAFTYAFGQGYANHAAQFKEE